MLKSILKVKLKKSSAKFDKTLYLQHHYYNQGTFLRAKGLALPLANRRNHIYITCISDKIQFSITKDYCTENPYVSYVKFPRIMKKNSILGMIFRLPYLCYYVTFKDFSKLYAFALGMPTNAIPALFFKIFKSSKIILDWDDLWGNGYGSYTGVLGNKIFLFFERVTPRVIRPKYVTCTSRFLKNKFQRIGFNEKQITVLNNGVYGDIVYPELKDRDLRNEYGIKEDTSICISIGNTYGKSFENMIKAFEIASRENPKLKLYLIGQFNKSGQIGKEIERVMKTYRELFLSKIIILGFLETRDYINYLKMADFAILPMEDNEIDEARFPIRLGDYVRYCLPIVSNANGPVRDILEKNNYGLICDVKDIDQFASNILQMSQNSNLYFSIDKVEKMRNIDLSWERSSDQLGSLLSKV